jgi:hypothetical protein
MVELPREPYLDFKKVEGSLNPIKVVKRLYDEEIDGLIKLLLDESINESIRHSIRKYLTVTIFAALDYYFRNCARNLIDKNRLSVASLFPAKSKQRLEKLIKENNTTEGNIVSSTYRFVDIFEIDFVFSHLLHMPSFLDYIIKLNDKNQTRFVLDGHPIPIEYGNLTKAYKLRNDIAHEVKEVKISKSRVIAMWDNLMNVMDISVDVLDSVLRPEERRNFDTDYQDGKNRSMIIATYKLSSDTAMSKLLENDGTSHVNSIIDELKNFNRNIHNHDIDWIFRRMSRQGLIMKEKESITLTLKGKKRFKRTAEHLRDKWKRELSPIVCSWIPSWHQFQLPSA